MTHALVLGAGVSGMAVARLARELGYGVTIYDSKPTIEPLLAGFGAVTGQWDHLILRDADMVIASPGFPERSTPILDAFEAGIPIVGEIEFAWHHIECPIVAITGTNGKTTVTEATSAMLRASGIDAPTAGNIGTPLSDFVGVTHEVLVVEVSSFQLRFAETFHPMAAALTNVAEDHLDWHSSLHSYRESKARIFANQGPDDLLVYDADDPGASSLVERARAGLCPLSGTRFVPGGGGVSDGAVRVMDVEIPITTLTNDDPTHLFNIGCSAALARRAGATTSSIREAAAAFTPPPHRRQRVGEWGGVLWVDDSKATNVHSALASIRSFDSVILIAGGLAKGMDISPLATEPAVKMAIGIGEAGPQVVEAAGDRGRLAGTMEVAVEMAAMAAEPGDTVLLAPGCASFDQFEGYAARGERFTQLARERAAEVHT
ncbi:MAG TPA: UDP-N-acetylmuramoyl-L-alanine--D-glutamate ligase [Acidimicrobiia bacterium]